MDSFVVFAKEPEPGKVKTRMTPPFSPDEAVLLYTAFIGDVCATIASCASGGDRRVLSAPGRGGATLAAIAKEHGFEIVEQIGADLGARMAKALGDEIAAGAGAVVLVGSDSPTLPADAVHEGVRRLHLNSKSTAVIGPAGDGGYWLIGAAGAVPDLFAGIAWSTRDVLSQTLARAGAKKIDLTLLPFWYDVDDVADVKMLDAHLGWSASQGRSVAPRTAAALGRIKAARGGIFPS